LGKGPDGEFGIVEYKNPDVPGSKFCTDPFERTQLHCPAKTLIAKGPGTDIGLPFESHPLIFPEKDPEYQGNGLPLAGLIS
jgi:hypothetical protein